MNSVRLRTERDRPTVFSAALARQLDDRAVQFERLKYGKLTHEERGRRQAQSSQLSGSEMNQALLVVTEANSRVDIAPSYENIHHGEHDVGHLQSDEVDELLEWTETLPAADETAWKRNELLSFSLPPTNSIFALRFFSFAQIENIHCKASTLHLSLHQEQISVLIDGWDHL